MTSQKEVNILEVTNKPIIRLTRDFFFATIFNKEENLCILEHFIAAYLSKNVKDIHGNIELLRRDLPKDVKQDAQKEVDVIVNLNNKKICIEMNAYGFQSGIRNRNLLFASKVLSREYKRSDKNFKNINKVLQINLTTVSSTLEYSQKMNYLINEFQLRESRNLKTVYSDILQIDIVDMIKVNKVCYNYVDEREKLIAKWCELFCAETLEDIRRKGCDIMNEKSLEQLVSEVDKLSQDKDMLWFESNYTNQELSYNSNIIDVGEMKFAEGQLSIIQRMIDKGNTPEEIEDLTGISIEEQERLLNKTE